VDTSFFTKYETHKRTHAHVCNPSRPFALLGESDRGHVSVRQWLRECEAEPHELDPNRVTTVAGWMARFMAAPALALYCRIHSHQPWVRKNLFFASSFALRACDKPRQVSSMQELHSSLHPRVQVSSIPECRYPHRRSPARRRGQGGRWKGR